MHASILKRLQKLEDYFLKEIRLRLKEAQNSLDVLEKELFCLRQTLEQERISCHFSVTFEDFKEKTLNQIKILTVECEEKRIEVEMIFEELQEHYRQNKMYEILKKKLP